MPSGRTIVLQLVGLALVTLLVSRLPDDVFALTQTLLLVAASLLLLAVALAVVVRPIRLRLFQLYGVAHDTAGPATADGEEARGLVGPVLTALACLFVAMVSALLRG